MVLHNTNSVTVLLLTFFFHVCIFFKLPGVGAVETDCWELLNLLNMLLR